MQTLDYYYDISFNAFLYPNIKDSRRIFSFLFEIIFKNEASDDHHNGQSQQQPSNEFDVILKRRLQKWSGKPWILPDFLKMKKPLFVGGGDKIHVNPLIDYQRVDACKSKKAKGVYELMRGLKINSVAESYS